MPGDFVAAIASCLAPPGEAPSDELKRLVDEVLNGPSEPSRHDLTNLQKKIDDVTGGRDRIALVYGGATKIKDYVFEAPKLPEIRGASALLDWVNLAALPRLWSLAPEQQGGIVLKGGGHILGFAPAGAGQPLAEQIERLYAEHTLTADSVAVAGEFSLLELRYGRVPLTYWIDQFLIDWKDERKRAALMMYYCPSEGLDHDDVSEEAARRRFYHRKTFGELVALLRIESFRRRAGRGAGEAPFYPLLPWSERCDSSDIRPAVWQGVVGDEAEQREISEASARKRYAGLLAKGSQKIGWFKKNFVWEDAPTDIEDTSWEAQWKEYLRENPDIPYARDHDPAHLQVMEPAPDVHQIGAASNGYIGVIYADGNNVGRLMATLKTPHEYHGWSERLRDAAKQAVFGALGAHLKPSNGFHPFEIIAIGGDDLLLIVPAKYAFEIALAIGYRFESNPELAAQSPRTLNDRYNGPAPHPDYNFSGYTPRIGLSAGVIIAQETAPIFFLRDLVEELLKSAKKLANRYAERNDFGGAVDFMVLKSIAMVTDRIDGFRRAALTNRADVERGLREPAHARQAGEANAQAGAQPEVRELIARPYTWNEFAGLLAAIRALQQARMPRSQLYRLRETLDEGLRSGVLAGSLEYLYTRARLRSPRIQKALLTHVERSWRAAPRHEVGVSLGAPPWLRMKTKVSADARKIELAGWETIWADLVEAYEMVEEREQP
jgi:CRISPR-associated protein Cmr2